MFYTYLYFRENGTPYYVGKGKGNRAFRNHRKHGIQRPKYDARIFIQYWGSEEEAFEMEKWYIKLFGRKDIGTGILYNKTDGGQGTSGQIFTEETKRKIGKTSLGNTRSKGHKVSEASRAVMSAAAKGNQRWLGRKHSEETKKRLSEVQKLRKPVSEETRAKISAAGKGRKFSEEHKRRLSESLKGRLISEEAKKRMSEARKGKPWPESTRATVNKRKNAT